MSKRTNLDLQTSQQLTDVKWQTRLDALKAQLLEKDQAANQYRELLLTQQTQIGQLQVCLEQAHEEINRLKSKKNRKITK